MLVLTGNLHESIIIGDDIEIGFVEFRGKGRQVKVCIIAPDDVLISRSDSPNSRITEMQEYYSEKVRERKIKRQIPSRPLIEKERE